MSYYPHDTIAAIATAPLGAARGMLRVGGPATIDVIAKCFDSTDGSEIFAIRRPSAIKGELRVGSDHLPARSLPCDLYYWPTERSYTRQPIAELHTIGSSPLMHAALDAVCQAGARIAEPGEFTLRAFLAGRIDLTQAEAVLGIVDAQHDEQLHTAIEQLAGNLAQPLDRLRGDLLTLLAQLEAGLDFVEDDIEFISAAELTSRLHAAQAEMQAAAEQMAGRSIATDGPQIVLMGEPNAGKSSLFNALLRRFGTGDHAASQAIVSDQRGTTRDYLTAKISVNGINCELVDTAGIERELAVSTAIDAAAQQLSRRQRDQAVLHLICIDGDQSDSPLDRSSPSFSLSSSIVVRTKSDLLGSPMSTPSIPTSSVTGAGLDDLGDAIGSLLAAVTSSSRSRCVVATADRCRDSVRLAGSALTRAQELASAAEGEELVAAEIRVALAEIGKVVGAVYTDDLLDRIFKTFCIGK